MSDRAKTQSIVGSADGTRIAYEASGEGPPLVLVASALADRSDTRKLAARLASGHCVISYDRRGRGASGDTPPYAADREVEDVEALIHAAGGSAALFGSSSGAVLALDAADRLGRKVHALALYEPPFIIDDSRPPLGEDLVAEISALLAVDRRADAVMRFMKSLGVPALGVAVMRLLPGWSTMCALAHTLPYDLGILRGTQTGGPLPAGRWKGVATPTLILTGAKSEAHFHTGAHALAELLVDAEHRVLAGQHHGSVAMGSKMIADSLLAFFARDAADARTPRRSPAGGSSR